MPSTGVTCAGRSVGGPHCGVLSALQSFIIFANLSYACSVSSCPFWSAVVWIGYCRVEDWGVCPVLRRALKFEAEKDMEEKAS